MRMGSTQLSGDSCPGSWHVGRVLTESHAYVTGDEILTEMCRWFYLVLKTLIKPREDPFAVVLSLDQLSVFST